ncbi:MAG: hypothetical protein Q9227_005538, partial [Pyrenula ochraceoflavens]
QRTTNPDGYAANISAWESALTHAARAGHVPSNSPQSLHDRSVLQVNDGLIRALSDSKLGRPLGLNAVLDEMVRKGAMLPLQEFLSSTESIYSRRWLMTPWQVLNWGLQKIGLVSSGFGSNDSKIEGRSLVILANVEDVGSLVMKSIETFSSKATDRIMDMEAFKRELSAALGSTEVASDLDLKVLLKYLQRDKAALSYDEKVMPVYNSLVLDKADHRKTVKLKPPSSLSPEPVTSQDTTIASLKTLISNLTSQCHNLEDRITQLQSTATAAVKAGNKTSALSALKSKKLAERNFEQRSGTLHQLEEVFTKIEQAADQVEIVQVMENSAGVLQGLNKQIGGVERAEDVVEDLREEMLKTDEVTQSLGEGPAAGQVDEDEVDEEFETMEMEQKREVEERQKEERRRVEERQAEETRKRLEELGKLEKVSEETDGEALAGSIEKLDKLDLDDRPQSIAEKG